MASVHQPNVHSRQPWRLLSQPHQTQGTHNPSKGERDTQSTVSCSTKHFHPAAPTCTSRWRLPLVAQSDASTSEHATEYARPVLATLSCPSYTDTPTHCDPHHCVALLLQSGDSYTSGYARSHDNRSQDSGVSTPSRLAHSETPRDMTRHVAQTGGGRALLPQPTASVASHTSTSLTIVNQGQLNISHHTFLSALTACMCMCMHHSAQAPCQHQCLSLNLCPVSRN